MSKWLWTQAQFETFSLEWVSMEPDWKWNPPQLEKKDWILLGESPSHQLDGANRTTISESRVIQIHSSILYSQVWDSPVFYFSLQYFDSGEPIAFHHLMQTPALISSTYHPLTQQIVYYIHPCQMNEWMHEWNSSLVHSFKLINPLKLWTSVLAQQFPLLFPLKKLDLNSNVY